MGQLHACTFSVTSPDGACVATVVIRPLADPPHGWTPVPRDIVSDPARCQSLLDRAHLWSGSVVELFDAVRSAAAA